ncbi:hypothetical protein BCD49_00280 [Pseudofrankia sp. EUN1h]|nr:hypothetical protein BCD49_00280 [Pseudofrankia sp. EUN1h]
MTTAAFATPAVTSVATPVAAAAATSAASTATATAPAPAPATIEAMAMAMSMAVTTDEEGSNGLARLDSRPVGVRAQDRRLATEAPPAGSGGSPAGRGPGGGGSSG